MKKLLALILASGVAASAVAQGTVTLLNNVTGTFRSQIYNAQLGNPTQSLTGNSTAGIPAGSTVYTGGLLAGSGYLAQLFSASGAGASEGSLVASVTAPVTFRTGSAAGLMPTATTVTLANVAKDASVATFQIRVWDNTSGLYGTWALAQAAWEAGTIAAGKSTIFQLSNIGGDVFTPPNTVGWSSFNIYYQNVAPVPEPSTLALAGLGGLSLLAFRRRK